MANPSHNATPSSHSNHQTTHAYQLPLAGHLRVTSEFGSHDRMHNDAHHPHGHGGMDLAAHPGTHVLAARDGIVLHSGVARGYGHWVVVQHPDHQVSIYGHLSSHTIVHPGQLVTAGQTIGTVGTAAEGHSTGPHLHFQINQPHTGVGSGGAFNPRLVLPPLH